jgi:hypothetical protein
MACIDATDLLKPLLHIYTLEELDIWLSSPHKLLGGRAPEGLIAEGRQDEVAVVIDQLVSGAFI